MSTRYTYYIKQGLLEYDGLVYEMVWTPERYESRYEPMWDSPVSPASFTLEFVWSPPRHLGEGEVRTRGLQPAIDMGFLRLVAPIKQ